jgi:hypothetical protein
VKVKYESAFGKDLKNIKDRNLLGRIKKLIEMIKEADTITELGNVKKLKGFDTFY